MSQPEILDNVESTASVTRAVGADRRQSARRDCEFCIVAVPVDSSGNQIGPIVAGHCLDVSASGIRITLAGEIQAELMRIEPIVDDAELGFASAIFKVVRQSSEYWCSMYAGPFVAPPQVSVSEPVSGETSHWPLGAARA